MAGWHHWLDAHEFGWTPGVGDGQGGLACCDSWGCKESNMTERLDWIEAILSLFLCMVWGCVLTSLTDLAVQLSQHLSLFQWVSFLHQVAQSIGVSASLSDQIRLDQLLTLCDPMNRSMPGLPVHHQLPEFTQTHVHWVGDAIQPSHLLSSSSSPALSLSQHQGLFKWVNTSHQMAKVLEFQLQHQSFQWKPRTDLLYNGLVGSPCSPRDSQKSSPTSQFKSISSSALSFLHSPNLTSIHDHWKNHSLD